MNGALAHVLADDEPVVVPPAAERSFEYFNSGEVTADDHRQRGPQQRAESIPILYPLVQLGERRLGCVLVVVVETDGDTVIMSSPKLRVWGTGFDVYEALADFEETLRSIADSYRQTPTTGMTEGAIEYLRELESYLR